MRLNKMVFVGSIVSGKKISVLFKAIVLKEMALGLR